MRGRYFRASAVSAKVKISEYVKNMEKNGATVLTFNSNRRMPTGLVGFVDHMIFYKGRTIYAEVKTENDRYSPAQIEMADKLISHCLRTTNCYYFLLTEENYQDVVCSILQENISGLQRTWRETLFIIANLQTKLERKKK